MIFLSSECHVKCCQCCLLPVFRLFLYSKWASDWRSKGSRVSVNMRAGARRVCSTICWSTDIFTLNHRSRFHTNKDRKSSRLQFSGRKMSLPSDFHHAFWHWHEKINAVHSSAIWWHLMSEVRDWLETKSRQQYQNSPPVTTKVCRLASINALLQMSFKMYRPHGTNDKEVIHLLYCHHIGKYSFCYLQWTDPDLTPCWRNNYFWFILGELRVSATSKTWRCGLNILFIAVCIMFWFLETSSQPSKPNVHSAKLTIWHHMLGPVLNCNLIIRDDW